MSIKKRNRLTEISFNITRLIIIMIVLYSGYLVYLYILFTNWQLASGGNLFIGLVQGIIPLSAIIFISLVLSKKIKLAIPI